MNHLVCGILAHVDAGKTTLSEAMLYETGMRRTLGRVDHGDSFLDTHNLERQRGITIFSKLAHLNTPNRHITLVDTPGHADFSPEAERTMPILDCAIVVINGSDGVQAHTLTIWELLERYQVPVFLFVNKMDLPGPGKDAIVSELQQKLSPGIVDFSASPEEIAENAAMCDDAMLEQYLSGGTITSGNLRELISERKLFPCCFGSALKLSGIREFLSLLDVCAPQNNYGEAFAAKVYKVSRDPQGVRLTWVKVTGGSLRVRSTIAYRDRDGSFHEEKCVQLRQYAGTQARQTDEIASGEICAIQGLSATWAGQSLGAEPEGSAQILEPVMSFRMNLPPDKDPMKVLPLLRQLEEEEPQLHLMWDSRLRQIRVQLMGRVQLEILQSLILERFSISVTFDAGRINYLETITSTVEGVGHYEPLRHYAECHLLLEPGEAGSGIVLANQCSADILDINYQHLIISHLVEKQHLGVLTGSPITDIRITLVSGRAHPKHTEGGDFRQATYRAVRQGLMQADSQLLEPWYEFTLTVPSTQIGRAITDIRSMSGEFDSPEQIGENSILRGTVPVSEVRDYSQTVASYTHGMGVLQTRMYGYRPCHNPEDVISEACYDPESDLENTPDSIFCSHGAGFCVKWNQVSQYMHLSSILEKTTQPEVVTRNLRMDDRELERIMEREFGPIKRRQYTAPANRPATEQIPIAPPRRQMYLIDGYNLLFAREELKETAKIDLGLARDRLLDQLHSYAGYKNCPMIVVFDGYKAKGNPGQKQLDANIQVVYTKEGQTGDAYIESMAAQIGNNYSVRVVTSDSLVQLSSFRSGLLRMSSQELWTEIDLCHTQMSSYLAELSHKENRKFQSKEVSICKTP